MPELRARIIDVSPPNQNGWVRITTDGKPSALQTQREQLIEEAEAFLNSGAVLEITYTEQESRNLNPHTQKPYINRYYESAKQASNGASASDGASARPRGGGDGDPGFGYKTWPDDAWRICLSVGTERALQLAALEEKRDLGFERLWRLAYAFAVGLYTTPKPSGQALAESISFGEQPSAQGAYNEPDPTEPPPYIDESWPPRD